MRKLEAREAGCRKEDEQPLDINTASSPYLLGLTSYSERTIPPQDIARSSRFPERKARKSAHLFSSHSIISKRI